MFEGFTQETSDFLWELSFNNERPWFQAHKEQFERCLNTPFKALGQETWRLMSEKHPDREFYLHISRIYRDARRLFGRGPYKDHLWFTVYQADKNEGPSFWFEISAARFTYGLGFWSWRPAMMERYRRAIDANPARFERLVRDAMRLPGFQVTGPEYKRLKKDLGPVLNPWYNRKQVGLEHVEDFDPNALGPELSDTLCETFQSLMPLYRYFLTCCRAAAAQDSDELRRRDHGDKETENLSYHAGLQL